MPANGLTVSCRASVDAAGGWWRYVETLENPGQAAVRTQVRVRFDLCGAVQDVEHVADERRDSRSLSLVPARMTRVITNRTLYSPMRPLDGMVVVITGASAGIGAALAEALSARGARLVLAARRLDRLEALNARLGGNHLCVRADVSQPDDCQRLIDDTVARFGRVDTLVCNAGYGILRKVHETTPQQMREIFETNVFGTADCVRAAVPYMLRQEPRRWRGQVVVVSSAVARRALPLFGAYSATKAAQLSLAEAMRVELRPHRIAVTSVHPIGTDTEFGDAAFARAGGGRIERISGEVRQSPQEVAGKMVRAIERPVPEVWPFRPSRWALGAAAMAPRFVDRLLGKRVRVEGAGESGNVQGPSPNDQQMTKAQ